MQDLQGKWEAAPSENARDQGGRDHGQVLPGVLQAGLVDLGLGDPLGLGPPVLEPDLDLGLSQLKLASKVRPLSDGQVALLVEFLLQLVELLVGEGSPGLPVRLVFPQGALQWEHLSRAQLLLLALLVVMTALALELGKLGHALLLLELLQEEQLGHPGEHRGGHHHGHGVWGREGGR